MTTKSETSRKRFSFGPVWIEAVKVGKVADREKLIAHAVKLRVGAKSDVSRMKLESLLVKVSAALQAETKTETPTV